MDGILVLAKPTGPTSHDMVALVRRIAGTRRIGHGGTLDPFASGVLPLFIGRATRIVEYHLSDRKAYRATICFGASSTTDDLEGELTPVAEAPDEAAVRAALGEFTGPIVQTPPAYSAVRIAGRRAYALARAGRTPDLRPRQVTIDRLELLEWDGSDAARPIAVVLVECSAGTYVRALARDLGRRLGSAAYLGALVRTASGAFRIEAAHMLDEIRAAASAGPDGLERLLLPVDAGLDSMPRIRLRAADVFAIGRGQYVKAPGGPASVQAVRAVQAYDTATAGGSAAGGSGAAAGEAAEDESDKPPRSSSGRTVGAPRRRVPGDSSGAGMPDAAAKDGGLVRLVDPDGNLVAIAMLDGGRLAPQKVLIDAPVAPGVEALREQAESLAVVEAMIEADRDPGLHADPDPASPDDA